MAAHTTRSSTSNWSRFATSPDQLYDERSTGILERRAINGAEENFSGSSGVTSPQHPDDWSSASTLRNSVTSRTGNNSNGSTSTTSLQHPDDWSSASTLRNSVTSQTGNNSNASARTTSLQHPDDWSSASTLRNSVTSRMENSSSGSTTVASPQHHDASSSINITSSSDSARVSANVEGEYSMSASHMLSRSVPPLPNSPTADHFLTDHNEIAETAEARHSPGSSNNVESLIHHSVDDSFFATNAYFLTDDALKQYHNIKRTDETNYAQTSIDFIGDDESINSSIDSCAAKTADADKLERESADLGRMSRIRLWCGRNSWDIVLVLATVLVLLAVVAVIIIIFVEYNSTSIASYDNETVTDAPTNHSLTPIT